MKSFCISFIKIFSARLPEFIFLRSTLLPGGILAVIAKSYPLKKVENHRSKMSETNHTSRSASGLDLFDVPDLTKALDEAGSAGYEFIVCPIVHPRFKSELLSGPAQNRTGPLTRSDLVITSQDWSALVVGKISPWIDVDSKNQLCRTNSEKALKQELLYAGHLSLPAVLINLNGYECLGLARCLSEHLIKGPNQQFWIKVPILPRKRQLDPIFDDESEDSAMSDETVVKKKSDDTWEWWHRFRTLCDTNKKVGVALELQDDIPTENEIERWAGEPVKAVLIPTRLFLINKKGYPVLPRSHQSLLRWLFKLNIQMIITGASRFPDKGMKVYQQYLEHIWQTKPPLDQVAIFAKGFEDYLQSPLQPLMDNLESQTYEVFEKDPIKYSQYQKAVYYALLERVPYEDKETNVQVVMVVGAGRGPLVQASIIAAAKAHRKIRVFAVEKNPNAVVTLENRKLEEWGEQVTVVSSDMRAWAAPEKADILVSELLGSFGDNELSPECLDGAQKFLKDDGISIPYKYTSYLAPIQSSRLFNEVRNCKDPDKPPEAPFETPFVVRLHNCSLLGKPQSVFTFHHPNKSTPIDNTRYSENVFVVEQNCVVHGIAGYFDTYLYKDVALSINPDTHSPGMFSWFPILFPIREPVYMKAGESLKIHFWRLTNDKNVWYEWCISEPRPTPIHNPKGRSYTIGL